MGEGEKYTPEEAKGFQESVGEETEEKKKPEPELTPEIIGRIMTKVKDINKPGTAFTSIGAYGRKGQNKNDIIREIFKAGLLGNKSTDEADTTVATEHKQNWVKNVRENHRAAVFFNVIGRYAQDTTDPYDKYLQPMSRYRYINDNNDKIIVLFDLDKYNDRSDSRVYGNEIPQRSRGYHQSAFVVGESKTWDDMGFNLSYRVPPRYFQGLVFKIRAEKSELDGQTIELMIKEKADELRSQLEARKWDEYFITSQIEYKSMKYRELLEYPPPSDEQNMSRASELSRLMIESYPDRSDLLIPIYDIDGNLYWPKKMSHDEIKQFVTERETEDQSK